MTKSLGNWWTRTISLDEELDTFQKKLKHLTALESDNLAVVAHEEIQPGKKRKREFEFWLTNVKGKKSGYSQIENELREQGPSKNLKSRIEKEIKEVEELIQQGKFPNGVVLDDHASRRLPMVTTRLVGRSCEKNVETISKLLKDDGVFAIGVYGMGGVGKTTIVKKIHNLLLDSDIAGQVYWVTASRDCSLEKLQNDIGKVIGLDDFSKEDNERKKALLFQRFSNIKNPVLIIDDLWDSYVMERIGIPLQSCGCKVVITTRKLEVCRTMLCQHILKIVPLSEADSWTLFIDKLGELPSYLEHIAVKIVEECGGLPLALITMGCCMRDNTDVRVWENALYELRKPAIRQDLMELDVFRILKFSFDNLKDHKVQHCFLSCVLFPEDMKIDEDVLVNLWINEGLLDDVENQQDRVNKGHVILNRLVNACLLESIGEGRNRSVKMHDLIRDMGIIITKEHPLFIAEAGKQLKQVPEEEKWSKDLAKVSLRNNRIEEIPSAMAPMTPNLTVLMLNRNPLKEIPDSFFVHMKALTVLNLSGTRIERVPESVSDLENLRGLLLFRCEDLIYVPSVAKLTKLRILDLEYCFNLREAPRGLESLKCVETISYIPWDVSDMIGFNKVIQSLTSLSVYRFDIQDLRFTSFEFEEWETFEDYEKAVWIIRGEFGEDKSSCLLPTTLECLIIIKCVMKGRCLGDVFQSLGDAIGVKHITIKDCRGLESISGTQQGSSLLFTTQLEYLELEGLPDLRSIAKLGTPHSFAHLRELFIRGCPKMKVMLPVTCTKQLHLPNLEKIDVEECEEVEEIFESNKATLSNPNLSLPKLKELWLVNLPKIKVIFPFTEELHLPNLERIEVKKSEEVEEIFETNKATLSNPILSLPNLKELDFSGLPKIKVIFPFTEELHLPNLEKIAVEKCEEVEEIFETKLATPSKPILSLPNLKYLGLCHLPELGSIYRGLILCTSLVNPIQCMDDCPKLKVWPVPGGLTSDEPWSTMESKQETLLLTEIDINQPDCLSHFDGNSDDDITEWGASLSL